MSNKIFSINQSEIETANEMFSDLQKTLKKIGIEISVSERDDFAFLVFEYENREVKKKSSRNAGLFCKNATKWSMPLKEYTNRIENGETAADIAKELGIGRATLFRRLKEARLKGKDAIEI